LATDIMQTMVSRSHGLVPAASRQPPHRSTTLRPSTMTLAQAPISSSSSKLASKASRTGSKPGAQKPLMGKDCGPRRISRWTGVAAVVRDK
jgi:hypothetical protein